METKHILGLDLGTNSIGWAMLESDENNHPQQIIKAGSRIIPMDAAILGDFEAGNSISQTRDRTMARGTRRMYERRALRRERLCRVLNILGALPGHYVAKLNRYGQRAEGDETKLAWNNGSFLFMDAFNEMCAEFKAMHPDWFADGKTIAYDWTIYYLRKKALTQPISKQELAWILMQFNQKRGYNQARGEEEDEKTTEKKEFFSLVVKAVRDTGEISKGRMWYEVELENGWIYKRQSQYPLDWVGRTKDFIVTTKLNEDGTEKTDKEGNVMRSFKAPSDDDWGLRKIKTEHDIATSGQTVGEYIYSSLLQERDQKIIGQLVRTIDRKFYKDEVHRIVRTQMNFIPELQNRRLYAECLKALYVSNETYRNSIAERDFDYLLVENILFYQRPLKSKKSLISECPHEFYSYKDIDGQIHRQYLKCVSKSHPLYEELRVRQFVENLHIYRVAEDGFHKEDCTSLYITDKESLVTYLLSCKTINEKGLLRWLAQKNVKGLSWNYVPEKEYPMAPTSATLSKVLTDNGGEPTIAYITEIWHILYSVSDKTELEQALKHYAARNQLQDGFVEKLRKQKPFAADYGAYSLKATKKLLALMRRGEQWHECDIDEHTRQRIEHIITGEYDQHISDRVREKCSSLQQIQDFQGLELWLAEYVIYGVRDNSTKWETPNDIDTYLHNFRLHSLNNPVVEQVVMETLRTVRDIWQCYGTIDEIHLEMGRDLKNPADKRKQMQQRALDNEKTNLRIKSLLQEFMNPDMDIEGVRAYSPNQQEILRIYEDGVLSSNVVPEDIQKTIDALSSAKQPTHAEVIKYRLWLDQKYTSPYTGEIIPLAKLFTSAYQIEHVIPQSRYFDDSLSNKVICEAEVNALKDRQLAHEFIANHGGEKVTLSGGKVVTILTIIEYENLIKKVFAANKNKLEKLLLDDIPESFIARQMNDSRYISRLMKGLLSNIVREQDPKTHEYEPEETSKNLIICNGSVTDRLKKDWGVNDVWNHIILPRFERLNSLLGTNVFTGNANGHLIPNLPLGYPSINKKRIDHRHHAMDAIVIACTTRNHVNLLSNLSAMPDQQANRMALNHLLRERITFGDGKHVAFDKFLKPWPTFTQDIEAALQDIIVSFKQNLRVINKSNNHYTTIEDGKKVVKKQEKGDNWAIRKSLHKETGFGLVNLQMTKTANLKYVLEHLDSVVDGDLRKKLRELIAEGKNEKQIKQYFANEKDAWADINLQKITVYYYTNDTADRYYATRTTLDDSFTADVIDKITDSGIRAILHRHLEEYDNDPKIAFSPDGIENMNRDIKRLNNGVPHKPIYKVRKYEKAEKFAVGSVGAKNKKFVEAAKGTNLFFAVYISANEDGKETRSFVTIPFKVAVDCQKNGEKNWKVLLDQWIHDSALVPTAATLKFILSPGDLVYVPITDEVETKSILMRKDRIYKMVSGSGSDWYFVPNSFANPILNKVELTQLNKIARTPEGGLIKETCIPIQIDRLGNIISSL